MTVIVFKLLVQDCGYYKIILYPIIYRAIGEII